MIPYNSLSATPQFSPFKEQANRRPFPFVDYERGGVALGDTSEGLQSHLWTLEYTEGAFVLTREGAAPVTLFARAGVTSMSFAFDQNMRTVVAFNDADGAWLWWFDPVADAMTFLSLPGALTPKVTLDIKGVELQSDSDIILAYTRANKLYYRQQRDRFATEYLLKDPINGELVSIGMNSGNRLQFKVKPNT